MASAPPTTRVVLQSDLRPTDVLLGRGRTIQSRDGNVRLRSLVATRRVEYNAASRNAKKKRIAVEIVELILKGGDDAAAPAPGDDLGETLPGRFLRAATEAEVAAMRQTGTIPPPSASISTGGKGEETVWVNAEMETVVDKVKQLLRLGASKIQVEHLSRLSQEVRERLAKERATAENERQNQQQFQRRDNIAVKRSAPTDTNADDGSGNQFASLSVGADDDGDEDAVLRQLLNVMFQNDGKLPGRTENGESNGGSDVPPVNNNDLQRSIGPAASISTEKVALWLNSITAALGTARTLNQKHRAAASTNTLDSAVVQVDLRNLGAVLYQFVTGVAVPEACENHDNTERNNFANDGDNAEEGENGAQRRRKRPTGNPQVQSPRSNRYDVLLEKGLPVSLCIVITSLLDATDVSAQDRYVSSAEVEEDLSKMLSNPYQHLLDPSPDQSPGILNIDNSKLYGRDEPHSKLNACFESVIVNRDTSRALVSITGSPGTGKSSLVESLTAPLAAKRGMFLSIKFDTRGHGPQPISRIFEAVDEYCRNLILINDSSLLVEIGGAVSNALGPIVALLKDMVPSLGFIIGGWPPLLPSIGQNDTHVLVMHSLQALVKAMAAPAHPLAVVIDDIQWADEASVEFMSRLITDETMQSVIFIACYRDQEVGSDHPWTRLPSTGMPTESIMLGTLERQSINDLLSDTLHLSPRLTQQLAGVLHAKTGGNPLFTKQLLRSLCDEGLLQFSAISRRWTWDIEVIRSKGIEDNVVDHMINVMAHYGTDIKWTLSMAACLGFFFDTFILQTLYNSRFDSNNRWGGGDTSIEPIIDTLAKNGIIVAADLSSAESLCKFAHHTLWQAAYELIPASEKDETHLQIGRQLLCVTAVGGDSYFLDIVVDQINRGASLITNDMERRRIVQLNLDAGERRLNEFSFQRASAYFLHGCQLVDPSDWEVSYDMCLRLFNSGTETQLILGDFESALRLLQPIRIHGKCLKDKLQAIHNMILMKFSQGNAFDALSDSLNLLEKLGESFPRQAEQSDVKREIGKTQALIAANTAQGIEGILTMKDLADQNQKATMKMMLFAARIAKLSDHKVMVLLCLRMVQKSIFEGLSPESAFAFSSSSFVFCGLGLLPLSNTCCNIASRLLIRFEGQSPYFQTASTKVPLLMSIKAFLQPMQACIEEFRYIYANPLAVKDVRFAPIFQVTNAIIVAPEPGKTLADVEAEIRRNTKDAKQGKHVTAAASLICLQTVLRLRGRDNASADPSVLTGEAMDQEKLLNQFKAKGLSEFIRKVYFYRMLLAYLFRRFDVAAEMAQEYQLLVISNPVYPTYEVLPATLYLGLIASEMLRQQPSGEEDDEERAKWQTMARSCLEKLKNWDAFASAVGTDWNISHKYHLLRAELAAVGGDTEEAAAAYVCAIQKAKEHCHINEEALARERSGLFHLNIQGHSQKGREDLMIAVELYRKWGANAKVVDVAQLLNEF